MPEYNDLSIISNRELSPSYYQIVWEFEGDPRQVQPGQFLMVKLPDGDKLVPRPFSVLWARPGAISVLYRVVGKGTKSLSKMVSGNRVNVLFPLGNCFTKKKTRGLCLVGGGVGIPPLYFYALRLSELYPESMSQVRFYLGAAGREGVLLVPEIKQLGCELVISTDDGSVGEEGHCVGAFETDYRQGKVTSEVIACGPHGMLKALAGLCKKEKLSLEVSMEEVMGCGFGACVGCAIKVNKSKDHLPYQLVCKDGPVFKADQLKWND